MFDTTNIKIKAQAIDYVRLYLYSQSAAGGGMLTEQTAAWGGGSLQDFPAKSLICKPKITS